MKKTGYFFFCFLPLFASIGLQFLITFPIMGFCMMGIFISNILSGTKFGYEELMQQLMPLVTNQDFSMFVSIAFAVSGILIFGIWYTCQFHGSMKLPAKTLTNPKILLGLIFVVPGLQLISSMITVVTASFFPGWMEFYESLMENAGFTASPSLLLVLYAVLLGPIEEEITFRGVILASAERSLPFWAANLFQALLFGIFHLNPIQGFYAFFVGIFLGYVRKRGGSVWVSSLLHILYNGFATFLSAEMTSFMFLVLFLAGMYLFHKNTSPESINQSLEVSDM